MHNSSSHLVARAALALAALLKGSLWGAAPGDNCDSVLPHNLLGSMLAPVFLFATLAWALAGC